MEVDFTQYYIIVRQDCEVTSLILTGHGEEHARRAVKKVLGYFVITKRATFFTILLDGWKDLTGKRFIDFVVDCPKGSMFLKCADFIESLYNANATKSSLEGVLEEVGIENVVQVITYTKLGSMVQVGRELKEKHKGIFWTRLSRAAHLLDHMPVFSSLDCLSSFMDIHFLKDKLS